MTYPSESDLPAINYAMPLDGDHFIEALLHQMELFDLVIGVEVGLDFCSRSASTLSGSASKGRD